MNDAEMFIMDLKIFNVLDICYIAVSNIEKWLEWSFKLNSV